MTVTRCVALLALASITSPTSAAEAQESTPLQIPDRTDPFAARHAFVELGLDRETWYLGETVPVQIRVGIEEEFKASLLPLFRRELSLPVQVLAPWLADDSTAALQPDPARVEATIALNDGVTGTHQVAGRSIDGRRFQVFETTALLQPDQAGELRLAGTALRLAYATGFREELFVKRVPTDPRIVIVTGTDLILHVVAPPERDRPIEFTGAVGSFDVRAEADQDLLRVGESLRLTMRIRGSGSPSGFAPPRLPALEHFVVGGLTDETAGLTRTIHWNLIAQTAGPAQVPPIVFAYLRPGPPAEYQTLKTRALDVTVLPGVVMDTPIPPARTPHAPVPAPAESATRVLLAALLGTCGLLALHWLYRRRRVSAPGTLRPSHAGMASAAFTASAGEPDADVGALLGDYLAQRLACSPSAVVGPDLVHRLGRARIPEALAQHTASCLEQWIGFRFGGPAPAGGSAAAVALVTELERAFQGPGGVQSQ